MKKANDSFFDFQILAIGLTNANERLINSFPDRDTRLVLKSANRTDKINKTKTIFGIEVWCEGYSEPFFARQPDRAVDKLMKSARITRVQEYINSFEVAA